jgi:succinate dehydrogenase hydrophobic anchor subunit
MSLPPDQSIKALWQGQQTENPTMTLQAIRILVSDYQRAARQRAVVNIGVSLLCAAFFAWCASVAPNDIARVGDLIMMASMPILAWLHWYQQTQRAPDATTSTMGLIDFYRAQVAREAPNLRFIGAGMAPLVIGAGVMFAGLWPKIVAERTSVPKTFLNLLPVLLLLVVWVYFFAVSLRRQKRNVAERLREIDAMRGL